VNADGESALHLCARRGDAPRVELLVASGADLALQNSAGDTPLHVVAQETTREPAKKELFIEVCLLVFPHSYPDTFIACVMIYLAAFEFFLSHSKSLRPI